MADEFFYKFNPDAPEVGPIDSKTLKQLAGSGAIQPESLLRRGTGEWVTASTVKGLFPGSGAASPPEAVPVAPPEAKPVSPAPIAAPITGAPASPPEAIPVAPPAADAGGGMSFPDLSQPKAAADVPAGLDSLVVAPKKPGGKPAKKGNAPAAKKPAAAPVAPKVEAPKIETPSVAAPKNEAPKIEIPKVASPKAEAPKVEAPKVDAPKAAPAAAPAVAAPAATKPGGGATNPYASDPPAGRAAPRRKGRGGLGSLFNFDVLIAPTVIKILFFLISALLFLGFLGYAGITVVSAVLAGDVVAIAIAAGGIAVMLIFTLIYIVILRVMAEVALTFFNINDNVRDMRDMMAEQQGTIE